MGIYEMQRDIAQIEESISICYKAIRVNQQWIEELYQCKRECEIMQHTIEQDFVYRRTKWQAHTRHLEKSNVSKSYKEKIYDFLYGQEANVIANKAYNNIEIIQHRIRELEHHNGRMEKDISSYKRRQTLLQEELEYTRKEKS